MCEGGLFESMDFLGFIVGVFSMRYVFFILSFISSNLTADVIDSDGIFSDSYEGYAYNQSDIYWSEESSYTVLSYKEPNLNSALSKVHLHPGCVEGGGGDCVMGVLYKKLTQDTKGNNFYLVKTTDNTEVWVQSNAWEANNLDDRLSGGMELNISEAFYESDTSVIDGAPNIEQQRNIEIKKILANFSPNMGSVKITAPGEKTSLNIKDSNLLPTGKFSEYPLEKDSYYYEKKDNTYVIKTTMFKQEGDYIVVFLDAEPKVPLNETLKVRDSACPGPDIAYVWLDTKDLKVEFIDSEWAKNAPIEFLVGEFDRSYSVKEIREFNGNRYALVEEHLRVNNPFVSPESDRVKQDDYTIPYKWIKIRDEKKRLRFWFSDFSC